MLRELAALGVEKTSLLVVPDYHRSGPSMANGDFCGWLKEAQNRGHEVVLHGYYHQRTRRSAESARDKIMTRFYTADEGEFYDLDYPTALGLIEEAQRAFETRGFRPRGFVAPAWLLGPEAERAVIDAGLIYTTTLRRVRDFVARREFASQSLVYSVRSSWRRGVSLGWNRWLFSRLRNHHLLRLSLHPPDLWCSGNLAPDPGDRDRGAGGSRADDLRRVARSSCDPERSRGIPASSRLTSDEPLRPSSSFPGERSLGGMALPAFRSAR